MMHRRNASGFTLIEAMVALLVLAIGVLGLASMQLRALQGAHASYQRSVATMAAQDMVERLWVQLGMQGVGLSDVSCPSALDNALVRDDDSVDVVKSAGETILDQWHAEWVELLPTLVMDVANTVVHDTASCRYTITVRWEDERFVGEDVSELVYTASVVRGGGPVPPGSEEGAEDDE